MCYNIQQNILCTTDEKKIKFWNDMRENKAPYCNPTFDYSKYMELFLLNPRSEHPFHCELTI